MEKSLLSTLIHRKSDSPLQIGNHKVSMFPDKYIYIETHPYKEQENLFNIVDVDLYEETIIIQERYIDGYKCRFSLRLNDYSLNQLEIFNETDSGIHYIFNSNLTINQIKVRSKNLSSEVIFGFGQYSIAFISIYKNHKHILNYTL